MAGNFKLIRTTRGQYRIHLMDGDGHLVAVSVPFESKTAAVQSITTTREIAGTAHIQDLTRRRKKT
ncbi:hypothetical protein BMF89_02095 [Arthrobacter sp. SRS-W-1-2016]|uniref:YegP family protein n=1 Tax=Arthrobacter sp. SRS-W-1-2016 TaxID=1930254 RepID=UPI0009912070|nr:YegP family protein [Arthrobacter sp. SRS-W-1-2016]OOP64779.1 hypothetical protein BMF89_02095 [Arthrobacter sp. SRS-W-1-2016]